MTAVPDPASKSARPALSPVIVALGWMIACGLCFGFLNTIQKLLTHQMHPPQVLCLRYWVGSAVLLPFVIRAGWDAYRPRRLGLTLGRGLVHTFGGMIWFSVLPFVTLAEQSAIGFTGPIFMMLGAWLFLRERMYAARWVAVLIAFIGVLIVLAPGLAKADVGTIYTVWLLGSSFLFAISFLVAKTLTRYDRPDAIVFWLGIVVGTLSIPTAIYGLHWGGGILPAVELAWQWPTPGQWGMLLASGLLGSSGHYCMTRAYQIADVSAVQSVRYLDLLWASLFGFLVFAHIPTVWVLLGGSVICGATLWITRYEARMAKR